MLSLLIAITLLSGDATAARLEAVDSAAEDLYDAAKEANWPAASRHLRSLRSATSRLAADGVTAASAEDLDALAAAVQAHDATQTRRLANALTARLAPELETRGSPLARLDPDQRDLELDVEARAWTGADAHLARLRSDAAGIRCPRGDPRELQRRVTAVENAVAARRAAGALEALKRLDAAIDGLEKRCTGA